MPRSHSTSRQVSDASWRAAKKCDSAEPASTVVDAPVASPVRLAMVSPGGSAN